MPSTYPLIAVIGVFRSWAMPTRTLAKLRFKLFGPIHNRWRLRRVLRTSPWRYYYDTIRAQWNERFTLFR